MRAVINKEYVKLMKACKKTNRKFLMIEKELSYFELMKYGGEE